MSFAERLHLRTQLLLATIVIMSALTAATLFVVRVNVRHEVRMQTKDVLSSSERAFRRIEREQAIDLSRTAAMLSELPTLKALMTTEHAPTIQDASQAFWELSATDALVLADRRGTVMAVHATAPGLTRNSAQQMLQAPGGKSDTAGWWRNGNELFRVVAQPIFAGSGADKQVLGTIVVGTRIDSAVARQMGHFSATEIALVAGNVIVASTLDSKDQRELFERYIASSASGRKPPAEVSIDGREFEMGEVDVKPAPDPLRCYMLLPLDAAHGFLGRLNRVLLVLGLVAAIVGAGLITVISGAITRPLHKLVIAARALGAGDSTYATEARGSAEVAELANTFDSMRLQLSESARRSIEAERLAALGRAAASISHDLRHHLAAMVANAEFLHDAEEMGFNRDEIYREIQRASAQMTDLIDSLLEISRPRDALAVIEDDLAAVIQRAAEAARLAPEHRDRHIDVRIDGDTHGTFDPRKLERVFVNLLLNACEASADGRVGVSVASNHKEFECRVWDTGPGIPASIANTVFEPFVSAGKNNGTGLGLAIASKIVRDHDGEISVERTSSAGTVILVKLPRRAVPNQRQVAGRLTA